MFDCPSRQPGLPARFTPLSGVLTAIARIDPGPARGSELTRSRRRQYQSAGARSLAIRLLRDAGSSASEIPRGREGEPLWPAGYTGSLAHSGDWVLAAVGSVAHWASIGVDIEPDTPLPPRTDSIVLRAEEREWCRRLPAGAESRDRWIFCAKECVCKAIYPLRGLFLGFDEVRIEFDADLKRFRPVPVSGPAVKAFAGLWSHGVVETVEGQAVAVLGLQTAR